jgi:hypothetical protein
VLDAHGVRIVHPVPAAGDVVRVAADGTVLSRRRSPLKPGPEAIFAGLVSFPTLLDHPHLTVEVLLCREDHVRAPAPVRGRRFLRDPGERRLREVLSVHVLVAPADARALVTTPPAPFTTRELATAMGVPVSLAQQAARCLLDLGELEPAGRRGAAPLHRPTSRRAGAGPRAATRAS